MSLDDVVNLQITKQTTAPTRLGFGIPLIMAAHDVAPDLVMQFKSLGGMTDAGFATTDPAYRAAMVAFSQNPKPALVCVGKRTRKPIPAVKILPKKAVEGTVYAFTFISPAGVSTPITYTVPNAATIASVCTDLAALIPTTESVTATASATYVQIGAPAGKLFDLASLPNPKILEINDVTADPGIAEDLADVYEADPSTWWALCLDSQSPAEVLAAAAWTEAQRKIQLANTSQSDVLKIATTDDLASTMKASSYARSAILFSKNRLRSYSAFAWLGCQLPKDPGSSTWAYKRLAGIIVDSFTDGEVAALVAKNCNRYSVLGGVPVTQEGYCCDGTADFLDVVHGVDWLYARIQEAVFGALVNQEKIPYTDDGVAVIVSLIKGVLGKGVKSTLLAKDPAPFVTAPKVADIDAAEKINRNLPDVDFGATLAGAIHKVAIRGVLSV